MADRARPRPGRAATPAWAPPLTPDGVNFGVYAQARDRPRPAPVRRRRRPAPARVIPLHPARQPDRRLLARAGPGLGAGQLYGFAAHGPWDPTTGCASTPPGSCSTRTAVGSRRPPAIDGRGGRSGRRVGPDEERRHRSRAVRLGGRPAARTSPSARRSSTRPTSPASRATRAPASRPDRRGTYAGFIEKIPYLVDLGVTAVELLPVFPSTRTRPRRAGQLLGLPAGLVLRAAPAYASGRGADRRRGRVPRPGEGAPSGRHRGHPRRRLQPHRRGRRGRPDLLASAASPTTTTTCSTDDRRLPRLQRLRQHDQRQRPDRPPAHPRQPALLGPGDARRRLPVRPRGRPVARRAPASRSADPPILWDIETDPVLAGTKLIAEAWDAGGLYQVGSFVGDRWVGVERPVPRRRPRLRQGRPRDGRGGHASASSAARTSTATSTASRSASINFVTCHDGFTLNDLVSYDAKHNEANGEGNRDGSDQNLSWNCGVEGPDRRPRDRAAPRAADPQPPRLRPARRSACRCCSWATRSAGRRAATTTRTARTTRRAGSTGPASSATPTSCGSRPRPHRLPPPVPSARRAGRHGPPRPPRATRRSNGAASRSASPTSATTRTAWH